MKRFTVSFGVEETLTVDEIWPDGGAPDEPTAEDVLEALGVANPLQTALDWSLPASAWSVYYEGE